MPSDDIQFVIGHERTIGLDDQNPRLTLMLASIAVDHQSEEAMREAASGPLRFMGFLTRKPDEASVSWTRTA